ncbi:MAG: hypothetical protein ACE37H_08065 [Phycisphaeraceae bacterium]
MIDKTEPEYRQAMERAAKAFAVLAVRNTSLENLHAGVTPVSETGDGSDIRVTDAGGREIPWSEVSRLNDDEMKVLMKQVVDRLYTCLLHLFDPEFDPTLQHAIRFTHQWDAPTEIPSLIRSDGK